MKSSNKTTSFKGTKEIVSLSAIIIASFAFSTAASAEENYVRGHGNHSNHGGSREWARRESGTQNQQFQNRRQETAPVQTQQSENRTWQRPEQSENRAWQRPEQRPEQRQEQRQNREPVELSRPTPANPQPAPNLEAQRGRRDFNNRSNTRTEENRQYTERRQNNRNYQDNNRNNNSNWNNRERGNYDNRDKNWNNNRNENWNSNRNDNKNYQNRENQYSNERTYRSQNYRNYDFNNRRHDNNFYGPHGRWDRWDNRWGNARDYARRWGFDDYDPYRGWRRGNQWYARPYDWSDWGGWYGFFFGSNGLWGFSYNYGYDPYYNRYGNACQRVETEDWITGRRAVVSFVACRNSWGSWEEVYGTREIEYWLY